MTNCNTHTNHDHNHGENCGHSKVKHGDHYDYLHDSHLHHPHEDHVDEHVLEVTDHNPVECNKKHLHEHVHSPDCEHESVVHGDHIDYIVDGRLHYKHNEHCDDHGSVEVLAN
jgi:hypothetical protein